MIDGTKRAKSLSFSGHISRQIIRGVGKSSVAWKIWPLKWPALPKGTLEILYFSFSNSDPSAATSEVVVWNWDINAYFWPEKNRSQLRYRIKCIDIIDGCYKCHLKIAEKMSVKKRGSSDHCFLGCGSVSIICQNKPNLRVSLFKTIRTSHRNAIYKAGTTLEEDRTFLAFFSRATHRLLSQIYHS